MLNAALASAGRVQAIVSEQWLRPIQDMRALELRL
jgi:hypothetical protein